MIEFHGIKFHPKNPDDNWVQLYTGATAEEVYQKDIEKKLAAERRGFSYYYFFEDEPCEKVINKIKEIIDEKINYDLC